MNSAATERGAFVMTGRYQAYPEYKDSGVEWLEKLPSDWQIIKVKFLLKDGSEGIKIGPFGSALKLEDMVKQGIRVYGQENVIKRDFTLGKRFISEKKYSEMKVYTADVGDILITMMGTSGKCQVVPPDADLGIIDSHLLKIRTNKKILPELFRLLVDEAQEIKDQIGKQGKGSIMHGLNSTIVKDLEFPLPSVSEQQKIAKFLDHETAKIDTLIAKQEKLIELLKEKRQAVISHAVTRGLNPDAPMKDSGVEWLGEVPEHWVVKKLKFCANLLSQKEKITTQKVIALENIEGSTGKYISTNSKYSGEDVSFKEGDILFGKLRPYLSKVFLCDTSGIAFGDILAFRPNNETSSSFLFYTMISEWFIEIVNSSTYGSKMPRASSDFINEMEIALPPVGEQIKVAKELNSILGKFEILTDKSTAAIELMKERKTALISAAVTGKIDVRHFALKVEVNHG